MISAAALKREARDIGKIANALIEQGTPPITALVMAGDLAAVRRVEELLKQGEQPIDVVWMIGSYARFEWAVKNLCECDLFRLLPELWVGSDPDDTNPEYLELWERARLRAKRIITDGRALPTRQSYTIYRGQLGDAYGISWTLDREIAKRFAEGAGMRTPINGKVLTRRVPRSQILAYLTQRGESELIVRP